MDSDRSIAPIVSALSSKITDSLNARRRGIALLSFCLVMFLSALPSASAAAAVKGEKAQSARSEVSQAVAATYAASSFVCSGTAVDTGTTIKFKVAISKAAAGGTLSFNGQQADIRRLILTIYVKATQGFYSQEGLSHDQSELLANHWLASQVGDPGYAAVSVFVVAKSLIQGLVPGLGTAKLTRSSPTTFDGTAVDAIVGVVGGVKATIYIAAHGKPYLVGIFEPSKKSGGTIRFSDYNKKVRLKVPSNVISAPPTKGAAT
ncbi:MAG TPA: hypothetical protein VHV57_15215 [Acidimicrobiales bacterium]|jgi:hypothetical protein|nr:hypothetical protein [Acidimicrobiales bacterium]